MIATTTATTDSPIVAFAGGGSGGHLYPALAVAAALRRQLPGSRFLFFGTQRPVDLQVMDGAAEDCELIPQTLRPIRRGPWHWPGILQAFLRSRQLCRGHLERCAPIVVVGTGGLPSVPAVREAHRAGIATALFNPDAIPGRANRYLASCADVVFVQWEETVEHFPKRTDVRVRGCPIRSAFAEEGSNGKAKSPFDLDPDRKTLLVNGGSQGAQTLNEAMLLCTDLLATSDDWQVLHLTGERDRGRVARAYRDRSVRAHAIAYTPHMADALRRADLVVSRAGASTLAEITALGRASVLLPYPFHRDKHQHANARCLVRRGAARIVEDQVDAAATAPELRAALEHLMRSDAVREEMAGAARRMGLMDAAGAIAKDLISLAADRGTFGRRKSARRASEKL